ncbi:VWA domain-containing protein [Candidatus Woesearchaeota archaeon]|nr:VWA domain-containing protein [Candidatus Woesearchaeota archaeon]
MGMLGITSFLNPEAYYLLIPAAAILAAIIMFNFVSNEIGNRKERGSTRIMILISKMIILTLLITALAHPYGEVTMTSQGDPKIVLLVDNSSSMKLLETRFVESLKARFEGEFPVVLKYIGSEKESAIGEEILNYLEKDTNILLISDGQSNSGASLDEVALLAANLNSTISAVSLSERNSEIGVYITGSDSSVKGVNNTYVVHLINPKDEKANLRVLIDNEEIINQEVKGDYYSFQKSFDEGTHKIVAEVSSLSDFFLENNRFYKTVSVVKKPRILLVQDSYDPVEQIFNGLYEVTKSDRIPDNLDEYYAIILNDMPGSVKGTENLADYLIDKEGGYYGNGLFVIGGFDSFDRGGYKGSVLESYLPVTVGKAAKKRGSSNIAIAIDFSGTTGTRWYCPNPPEVGCRKGEWVEEKSDVQEVNKALASSIIKSLGPDNTVGVSIFSSQSGTVQELAPLFMIKEELLDKIARIQQPPGQSFFNIGLTGAYLLLKDHVGSNNIILITDGQTGSDEIKKTTIDTAKTLSERGVKVYVVGTGRSVNDAFLKDIAYNGRGVYFPADKSNNLKILFGEAAESKFGEVFDLFILNPYHFITQGLALDASLYGFNQVIPKSNAITLVTTQHGEPAVTVWNYGLGRVATLNVFSGNNNLGELMNSRNSVLLTRITNWVIGDPQRKEDYYVTISDARVNKPTDVIIKSVKYPDTEGITLTKIGENQYKTIVTPEETGFSSIIGKEYAINYEEEFQNVGMNSKMEAIVGMSGGKLFEPKDVDEMIDFVKSVSKKTRRERTTIVWPFLIAAACVFLIELLYRKIREYRLNG